MELKLPRLPRLLWLKMLRGVVAERVETGTEAGESRIILVGILDCDGDLVVILIPGVRCRAVADHGGGGHILLELGLIRLFFNFY